jgi:hypothetical protein
MVADGMPIAKILKEHPTLEAEDIGPLDRGQVGLVAGARISGCSSSAPYEGVTCGRSEGRIRGLAVHPRVHSGTHWASSGRMTPPAWCVRRCR